MVVFCPLLVVETPPTIEDVATGSLIEGVTLLLSFAEDFNGLFVAVASNGTVVLALKEIVVFQVAGEDAEDDTNTKNR